MVSRVAQKNKKAELLDHLRHVCIARAAVGGALPTVRELSREFSVSLRAAHSIVTVLREEGLVSSVRGSGTTVNTRRFAQDEVFLYCSFRTTLRSPKVNEELVGFSDRLAELGAFVLAGDASEDLVNEVNRNGVRCRGLFTNSWDFATRSRRLPRFDCPVVGFGNHADPETDDSVRWDDRSGGRLAAEHLLSLGHRSIVYIGKFESGEHWPVDREMGFRDAMNAAPGDKAARSIVFDPPSNFDDALEPFGREAARILWDTGMPDAVVAVNDRVATAFLEELLRLDVPLKRWPAIIGFDDASEFRGQSISSMRLDPRAVGRAAADHLWERAHDLRGGPPAVTVLPMQLVPRMTSQAGWAYRLHRIFKTFPHHLSA